MTTPVEKRNANKFCEFHGEVGHNTDECNHLRKQIEDMPSKPEGKLQRQKAVRQRITQSFLPDLEISFPSLGNDEGAEGPLIIEAEVGGHQVHRMFIDEGHQLKTLRSLAVYRLPVRIEKQMVPATTFVSRVSAVKNKIAH
ncbi:hypothetical protein Tco_0053246 [Tanacetum coccineum]